MQQETQFLLASPLQLNSEDLNNWLMLKPKELEEMEWRINEGVGQGSRYEPCVSEGR